jgi:hypothetical protein
MSWDDGDMDVPASQENGINLNLFDMDQGYYYKDHDGLDEFKEGEWEESIKDIASQLPADWSCDIKQLILHWQALPGLPCGLGDPYYLQNELETSMGLERPKHSMGQRVAYDDPGNKAL